jgi:hypothetical protein
VLTDNPELCEEITEKLVAAMKGIELTPGNPDTDGDLTDAGEE